MPDKNIINIYTELTKPYFDMITSKQKENHDLASLRDFLLPMLMNGQVTFKDTDEAK